MDRKKHINGFNIGHTQGLDTDEMRAYFMVIAERRGTDARTGLRYWTDVFELDKGYSAIESAIDDGLNEPKEYEIDGAIVRVRVEPLRDDE